MAARTFPEGFVWGTATAAHQVEGGNWNNDWWEWEHTPGSPCQEPSGDACDHWHRYPADIRLCAELGFGAYRFSLEWSRIEPEEGEFSRATLDHYRRMCATCHEYGLEPIVTFHHFTTPRWVAARGGWVEPSTSDHFARFCERAAAHLGGVIGRACTVSEPNIVATMGHLYGIFPPGKRDADLRRRANTSSTLCRRWTCTPSTKKALRRSALQHHERRRAVSSRSVTPHAADFVRVSNPGHLGETRRTVLLPRVFLEYVEDHAERGAGRWHVREVSPSRRAVEPSRKKRATNLRQRAPPPEPPRIAATDRSACGVRERTALGSVQRRESQHSR